MGSYYLTALALVLAIPIVAMAALVGLVRWSRDALARAPVLGALGIVSTYIALANLFVARACGDGINRPIIAAAVGTDECRRLGVSSVGVALVLLVATPVVTRLGDVRR